MHLQDSAGQSGQQELCLTSMQCKINSFPTGFQAMITAFKKQEQIVEQVR